MVASLEELAMAYHQAWVDLNPDTIVAMHSEDSIFHMHGAAEPAVGREAIHLLIVSLLQLVPDVQNAMNRIYLGTDHIALEYDMSGTFDGASFTVDAADVIAVANGLVTRKDTYFDAVSLIAQVGPLPLIGAPA
jgi:SnoaL-like domain